MKQPNKKVILLLLAALNFTHILDFMIMMPLGNYLMPYFNISPKQFSYLVAAYTLSAALSGFLAAFFVDRYDRKKVLLIGYGGFLLGTFFCGIAPGYVLLLIARIIAGLFGGLIGAQVLSIVSDLFSYEERGKAMGSVISAFAIASTFGVPFALYLANLISWHAPFLFVAIAGIGIFPFLYRHIPRMTDHFTSTEGRSKLHALHQVVGDSRQMLAMLFSLLWYMGHFFIIPFINPYLEFNMGYSKVQTPMIYLVGGAASFIAANIFGKLADRFGKLKMFVICMLVSLVFVLLITHLTSLPPLPFAIVLSFFACWFISSTGRGVASQALISNVVPMQSRGSFMSFNSSVQSLGTGLASFGAGAVVTADATGRLNHYSWLGYISVGVLFLCMMLARYLFAGMDKR
ncbi:MAG TPA: MFS transporter [Chitinophagaceae bacterium]|nr:MFS transporter [Chitinophagaceae bacterium]